MNRSILHIHKQKKSLVHLKKIPPLYATSFTITNLFTSTAKIIYNSARIQLTYPFISIPQTAVGIYLNLTPTYLSITPSLNGTILDRIYGSTPLQSVNPNAAVKYRTLNFCNTRVQSNCWPISEGEQR